MNFIKKGLIGALKERSSPISYGNMPSIKLPSNPISGTKSRIEALPLKYVHSIIYGRNDYSPKVKTILSTIGDENIVSIQIARHPLPFLLEGALNSLSFGKFKQQNPYDKLFHLSMIIRTTNHITTLEKNEVINMELNPKLQSHTETIDVPISRNITINELLRNTQEQMRNNFFPYSAYNNNCQDFIVNVLTSNHLDTPENIEFTKQNTEQLFEGLDYLRKIANTITDVAGRFDVVKEGGDLSKNNGLSSDEIDEIMRMMKIRNFKGCYSKNKLPDKLENDFWYIVNLENSNDGNGTHWTCFRYTPDEIIYFDSYGFYPPIEIMEKSKGNIIYCSKQIQDINATSCGWYCIGCIMNSIKSPTMNEEKKFKRYIDMFCNDTRKNDGVLRRYINT